MFARFRGAVRFGMRVVKMQSVWELNLENDIFESSSSSCAAYLMFVAGQDLFDSLESIL